MNKKEVYTLISILSGTNFLTLIIFLLLKAEFIPNYILFTLVFILTNILILWFVNLFRQKTAFILSVFAFIFTNLIISALFLILRSVLKIYLDEYSLGILIYSLINGALFIISLNATLITKRSKTIIFKYSTLLIYLLLASVSIIAQYIANIGVSFDQTINIDAYQHLVGIKEIFLNNNIVMQLRDASNTFTLTTYLPFFHYIFGLPMHLSGVTNYIESYRMIEITFSIFSTVLVYSGLSKLTESKIIGIVGAILSTFAFESYGAYTTFYLLPQTFTTLIGLSTFFYLITSKKVSIKLLLTSLLLLILNHFFVGTIFAFILIITYFYIRFEKPLSLIISFSMLTLLIIIGVSDLVSLNILKTLGEVFPDFLQRESELVQLGTLDFLNSLFRSFGPISTVLLIFIPLSIFSKDKYEKLFGFIFLIIAGLITIKFPYSNKLLLLTHYFGVVFISYLIFKENIHKSILGGTLLLILLTGLIFNLEINTSKFVEIFGYKNQILLGNFEREIAEKINITNEKNDYILISDPLTMHLIEPFIYGKTAGGIFTNKDIRIQIWKVFNTNSKDTEAIRVEKSKLQALIPDKRLVYLSTSRTTEWAKKDLEFIVGYGNQIWNISNTNVAVDLKQD